jgi:hypothetical protein
MSNVIDYRATWARCAALNRLAGHAAFEPGVQPGSRQALAILSLGLGPTGSASFLWNSGISRGDPRLLGTSAHATPVAATPLLVALGEGAVSSRIALATLCVAIGGWLAAQP